jgi:hypothetical protein
MIILSPAPQAFLRAAASRNATSGWRHASMMMIILFRGGFEREFTSSSYELEFKKPRVPTNTQVPEGEVACFDDRSQPKSS